MNVNILLFNNFETLDIFGKDKAIKIVNDIEYIWNDDCTNDIFAR